MENQEKEAGCQATSQNFRNSLKAIILRSRLALGLPDITRDVVDKTAEEFDVLLDKGITDENLESVYLKAMRDKCNGYALSYVELNTAWREMKQQEKASSKMQCPGCKMAAEDSSFSCPVHNK